MAATSNPQTHIILNNLSSNRDRNVIQAPNPMFFGMTNQLVAMNMTSRGRHIGFQDGRHQQPQTDIYFLSITLVLMG